MFHPYQLHSLGKLYHEEALKETRLRYLAHRAKAPHRPRSEEEQGLWSRLGKLAAASVRLS
jgi:hypothetical protein